ncbi:MAG: DUF896 domain-containing protein [Spirochaetales bacterium]|nr:DUF896 domain-containing protein [Spirochaetales bacterium]
MTMDQVIERINELYHLSKERTLTDEEKAEQKELRQRYVNSIKSNLTAHLENVVVQHPDGTRRKLKKKN